VLENVKKKLNAASNEIDRVGTRTSVINRKLRAVQELPVSETSETETEALPPADDAPEMAALPPAAEPPIELSAERQ
jgi:DNA anti-recombination protein RmuC